MDMSSEVGGGGSSDSVPDLGTSLLPELSEHVAWAVEYQGPR